MSFLRVKFIEANFEEGGAVPVDPFCAVKILEVQSQNDDDEPQLIQKKKTFYPQWNRCFDSHLVQGRRMQVIVMDKQVGRRSAGIGAERERERRTLSLYPSTASFHLVLSLLPQSHRKEAMIVQWHR